MLERNVIYAQAVIIEERSFGEGNGYPDALLPGAKRQVRSLDKTMTVFDSVSLD